MSFRKALAAATSCEVGLSNPRRAAALRWAGKGAAPLRTTVSRNADALARDFAPVPAEIGSTGATMLRGIAAALNERGVLSRLGGTWSVSNVQNLIARLEGAAPRQDG